mgnify:CR=1 FL=1
MKQIIFVADFFYKDFTGGAELNDYSLIQRFRNKGVIVKEVHCKDLTIQYLKNNKELNFIVANFVSLSPETMDYMTNNLNYIIYEHDHKYLKTRNPIFYKNFIAPSSDIVNYEFYENAKSVVCLTDLAIDVFKKNTGLENISKMGSSVWKDEDLDYILSLSTNNKNNKFAIMDSTNPIKRTRDCVEYCQKNNIEYALIKDRNHRGFLEKLSHYKGIVFMTGHLETCSRLLVEAKMMNCKVITQKKLIGAASEDWFSMSGEGLVGKMREISQNSPNVFLEAF